MRAVLATRASRLSNAGIVGEVDPQRHSVDHQTDQRLDLQSPAVGQRHADHHVVLPAVAMHQHFVRRQHRHERGHAARPTQRDQLPRDVVTVLALLGVKFFLSKKTFFKAWFASALTIAGTTFFGMIGLFPNLFPSSLSPKYSLTAYNASSSPLTLKIMLIVVILFIPVVIGYQIWAYRLFKDKVTEDDLAHEEAY